jgi:hypothetical protein
MGSYRERYPVRSNSPGRLYDHPPGESHASIGGCNARRLSICKLRRNPDLQIGDGGQRAAYFRCMTSPQGKPGVAGACGALTWLASASRS